MRRFNHSAHSDQVKACLGLTQDNDDDYNSVSNSVSNPVVGPLIVRPNQLVPGKFKFYVH